MILAPGRIGWRRINALVEERGGVFLDELTEWFEIRGNREDSVSVRKDAVFLAFAGKF